MLQMVEQPMIEQCWCMLVWVQAWVDVCVDTLVVSCDVHMKASQAAAMCGLVSVL